MAPISPLVEVRSAGHARGVLRDITVSFEQGRLAVVAGRSGSGKSTLCHLIAGVMRPSEGEVLVAGKRPYPAPARAFTRAFRIGYPSIYDPSGKVLLNFAEVLPPSAIPSTMIIDGQGRLQLPPEALPLFPDRRVVVTVVDDHVELRRAE